MGTSATISIKRNGRYTNVRVNFDGMPSHMLKALSNVTDEQILAAREIRGIDEDGTIEAYSDAATPSVTLSPERGMTSYTYARNDAGDFELV